MKLFSLFFLIIALIGCQNHKSESSVTSTKDIDQLEQLLFSKRDSLKISPDGFQKKADQLSKKYNNDSDSLINAKLNFFKASYLNWEQEDSLSLLYYKKSIPILKHFEKQSYLMLIDGSFRQGAFAYRTEDYEAANRYFKQSVYYGEKYFNKDTLTHKYVLLAFGAYGSVNRILYNYEIAEQYLKKTIALCTTDGTFKSKLTAYSDLALVYNDLKKYPEAIEYNKKAELLALEFQQDRLPLVYNHFASIYYDRKDWNNVLLYLKKEYEANPETPQFDQAVNLSATYLNLNKAEMAKPYITYLEDAYRNSDLNELQRLQVLERLPKYYIQTKDFSKANVYFDAYTINQKTFYDTEKAAITEDYIKKYDLKEKEDKIDQLHQKNYYVEAKLNQKNTALFISLLIFLLLLTIAMTLYFQQRNRKLKLDKKLLIMEDTLLRSQMEPHFVFNALSSLQSLIYENQNQLAAKYLSKFARLLRLSLEHSRMKYVPFTEEIESIENYLELQKMRFSNKFSYTISGNAKALEDYSIPPLMIQPFVENAIYHGFAALDYHGELHIEFQQYPDYICFTIEDNGLGIEASKINSNKTKTSLSTAITMERLKSLDENKNKIDFLNIQKNEEKPGTTVILKMPYTRTH